MARGLKPVAQAAPPAAAPPAPGPAAAPGDDEDEEGAEAAGGAPDAAGGAQQPPGAAGAGQGKAATPEQQQQYNAFIVAAMRAIYSGKSPNGQPAVNPSIIERLKVRTPGMPESDQAISALASLTVIIERRVEQAAQQSGKPVQDPAVLYHAGTEIMEDLAEIAEKAQIHSYTPKELTGAWIRAVDLYQQQKSQDGSLAQSKPALQHDWGQITGAARAGNLDAVLPGLSAAAKQMPAAPQAQGRGMGGRRPPPAATPAPDQQEG
jgi:hypothetical protein